MAKASSRFDTSFRIHPDLRFLEQKWTVLIIREALLGLTRFAEFRESLGIASDVLSSRLSMLVDEGILRRGAYEDKSGRSREEYLLTVAGRGFVTVLAALSAWVDQYRSPDEGHVFVYDSDHGKSPVHVAFVDEGGAEVEPSGVTIRRAQTAIRPLR
jgi:DNA-binding HxlR family transcriptional regulator